MAVAQEVPRNVSAGVPREPPSLRPIAQEPFDRRAEARKIVRVLNQKAGLAVDDLVDDSPTALATTGRLFHIASATVSPNPSARLF